MLYHAHPSAAKEWPGRLAQIRDLIETVAHQIQLGEITFANDRPFALLGGVNVLEDLDFALRCSKHYKDVCED